MIRALSGMLAAAIFLFGCGTVSEPSENARDPIQQEESAGIDFRDAIAGAQTFSHIRPDPLGYETGDVKEALFTGTDLSDTFWVVETGSKKRVYQGSLKPGGKSTVSENDLWIGDFSELTAEGEYYIETPVIGQSESFVIRENPEQNTQDPKALWKKQISDITDLADVEKADRALQSLLVMGMAVELYPDRTTDLFSSLVEETDRLTEMKLFSGASDSPEQMNLLSHRICHA